MSFRALLGCAFSLACSLACTAPPAPVEGEGEGEGEEGEGEGEADVVPAGFFESFVGLWEGPATQTPLGDFPTMNMDLRAADDRSLFSRADLDDENALRFAFDVEDLGAGPELVFRNGGFFLGILRDSRTRLVAAEEGVFRFCSVDRGCDYIDATWTADVEQHTLQLDAQVLGAVHVKWDATRAEERLLPASFDPTTGAADLALPDLSTAAITVSYPALAEEADVWVFLSTENCGTTFNCTVARQKKEQAPASSTSSTITFEQVHAGEYLVNVLLDRDQNLEETLAPSSGDGVAAPDGPLTVDGAARANAAIVFTLP